MKQTNLFYENENEELKPEFEIGKAVRNATYHQIKPELPEKRQRVFEVILVHPKGITNKQIALELKWPINCVTGRVSELREAGFIKADGVKYLPDHEGRMHPNTLWRAL